MSIWTHVAGVIRLDYYEDLDKIFIKETAYQKDLRDECNMPMGNEGSLDYQIVYGGFGTKVLIFGDLRGRGANDIDKIKEWWKGIIKNPNLDIRQAVLQICPEDGKTVVLQCKDKYNIKY